MINTDGFFAVPSNNMKFTAIIEYSQDGWYVGQLEELPEVISQGKSIDELKTNLLEGLVLLLNTNRQNVALEHKDKNVVRAEIEFG